MSKTMNSKRSPAGGVPEIDGIEFGEVYAEVREGLGEADFLEALRVSATRHRSATWWLGDLLAYGEKAWGNYGEMAAATGFAVGSLKNMASVSRSVPPEMREPGLPWRTHKVVAPLKPDEQREWLGLALAKGIKSDDLARAIKATRSGGSGEPEDPVGSGCVCPKCGGTGVIEETAS